jgi:hypothetical protein
MNINNIFVFVVCGSKEHIDTLHISINYLRKYSLNKIIVVTDSKRNEIKIIHDTIIDVKTPPEFSHHQSSIYLKTGLFKILPKGNNYCYLDTDVVAISDKCDEIFKEFYAPIIFAPDHCNMPKFSPNAVHCGCNESWAKYRALFDAALKKYDKNRQITNSNLLQKAKELQYLFYEIKKSLPKKIIAGLKYYLSINRYQFNKDYYFDKKNRTWHINSGEIIMYEVNVKKIEEETGLRYNKWKLQWLNSEGEDIWQNECNHLPKFIYTTFGVKVKDYSWQHWNGGVFLFNDQSHQFLEAWHNKTIQIFDNPKWKTRDQGTLIATAWEFGLNNHPTLNKKWNFIADYNNKGLTLDQTKNLISDNAMQTAISPNFIHVYHHWADENWDVWNWVREKF